ncbi:bifunctional diaminohydroxyphosphoribosylaminopyrimidine deaminase/5-amino-6-(5-phosphoribosylamino)uracil reductase RibD [Microbacterium sp. cx-55]|uniref:bifunctional diaminohydroxyphosphoribosylaminopyrimidine deaminase/5-amino-6-(5-phosphoribosylamino)uracil reductase RibD n=1 Tax=Microbacterium sp. cx-55 TaxID=2875948 RepID=UPI001CBE45FB|nr:bifunctional diaminohydroxyphosphoribosylaminopyrimidine deaminase/5-amino-6-(5-phosphoribosylamino)uracil reductase RibD [Microbacterium sp. cx-55]MBZ4487030.1 bifunctional diaminohydroxyphosphoribosylaminopyrimidine deaminase/5-amino-6-(5-phosphoribosylamino)uracil reductase RibD [Microbacterium sp. cx-55]UGB35948.1 bifunctional diaminohydroxyphosphoribosylaminopyrimidine deaminase/5-amino-6-(5-phosphoribosylamino)uracil reductase RibD [Microbacterium sp. cx-55]
MTVSDTERRAMAHALEIARRGPTGVNPQVGAVILGPDGDVLAEGWHHGAGTPHAEVDALSHLAPGAARGATAVVTLEPCNHTGRTGPCAVALLEAGIARVVYALPDPTPVASGGADRLRAGGVSVESGVLADDARDLLSSWTTMQMLGRPHVTVKWAQSLDGRAAAADGTSQWITGPDARADVHRRRADADAIVVGTGTVLADDPALTARRPDGSLYEHQPLPVVLGDRAVPDDAALRQHPRGFLHRSGANLFGEHAGDEASDSLLIELRELGVQRVFVEGGPTIASAFIRAGLADEILAYVAPTLIGYGPDGTDHPAVRMLGVDTIDQQHRLQMTDLHRLGDDLLIIARPASTPLEGVR